MATSTLAFTLDSAGFLVYPTLWTPIPSAALAPSPSPTCPAPFWTHSCVWAIS